MAVVAMAAVVTLTGCGESTGAGATASATTPAAPQSSSSADANASHDQRAHDDADAAPLTPELPSAHVHGIGWNPADGLAYLATHDGLFRYDEAGLTRVGPVIDLMGFAIAGPDHFYASGHPGPGVDLPQPVGLIESRDGGRTWAPLSRQGQSDFHVLTASSAGVVGFDGDLRATTDGVTWQTLQAPAAPYALAASADGRVLVATAQTGLLRSGDGGGTWQRVEGAPLLMLVDWTDGEVVAGVTPDGTVAISDDAGVTWEVRGATGGAPQAMGSHPGPAGAEAEVLVVTDTTVLHSRDAGATFDDYRPGDAG